LDNIHRFFLILSFIILYLKGQKCFIIF